MRKLSLSVTLVLMMIAMNGSTRESVRIHNGFLKAGEYLEMPESVQRAYAMGILDGFYMAPMFGAPDDNKRLIFIASCVEGMKSSQVQAIILKYVKDHPQRWHLDLKEAAYNGVLNACQNP